MLKRFVYGLMLFLCSGLYAWAGGQAEADGVTLRWLTWGNPEIHGHREIADMFEAQNPHIRVEIEQVPFARYEDVVRTRMAAGDPPDIMQVNDSYTLGYYMRGLLEPLDAYLEQSHLTPAIQSSFEDTAVINGERIGWGMALGVRLMFYNVDMFEAAGLDRISPQWENPEWNWDRLIEIAQQLNDPDNNVWGVGIIGDTGWEQIMTYNLTGEGIFSSVADRENQQFLMGRSPGYEAMQMLADLSLVHGVQPPWGVIDDVGVVNLFAAGQLGIAAGISQHVGEFRDTITDFEWDIAPIPMIKHGRNETSGRLFGIPRGAQNKDEAFALMEFSMSEEAQAVFGRTGYGIPVTRELTERLFIDPERLPRNQQVLLDGYDYTTPLFVTPPTEYARQVYRPVLRLIWTGEQSAREALTPLVDEIEGAIKESWRE